MALCLYYFTCQKFGIQSITNKRIKISRITDLNDPFEFLGLALHDKASRRALRITKKEMSEKTGMICMSKSWTNPLMWTHYADNHRGVCLGFDVSEDFFDPVIYRNNRLTLDDLGITNIADLTSEHMKEIVLCKFDAWQYESEYRAHVEIDETDPATGLAFMDFGNELKLQDVIVGCESNLTQEVLTPLLSSYSNTIRCIKARPAFKSFDITRDKSKLKTTKQ